VCKKIMPFADLCPLSGHGIVYTSKKKYLIDVSTGDYSERPMECIPSQIGGWLRYGERIHSIEAGYYPYKVVYRTLLKEYKNMRAYQLLLVCINMWQCSLILRQETAIELSKMLENSDVWQGVLDLMRSELERSEMIGACDLRESFGHENLHKLLERFNSLRYK